MFIQLFLLNKMPYFQVIYPNGGGIVDQSAHVVK